MSFETGQIAIGGALERRMESKMDRYKVLRALGDLAYKHLDEDWGEVGEKREAMNEMAIEGKVGVAISVFQLEGIWVRVSTVFNKEGPKTTLSQTRGVWGGP